MIRALLIKSKFMSRVEWRDVQQKATSDFSVFTKCFTWKRVLCFFVCPHRFRDDGVGFGALLLALFPSIHSSSVIFLFCCLRSFFSLSFVDAIQNTYVLSAFFRLVVRMYVSFFRVFHTRNCIPFGPSICLQVLVADYLLSVLKYKHTHRHIRTAHFKCARVCGAKKSVRTVHIYSRDMERKLIWFFFFISVCLIE